VDFKVLSLNFPGRTEVNRKLSQVSRSLSRDSNPGPPKYEAELLMTQSQELVSTPYIWMLKFKLQIIIINLD
jgi:hypothetical protein